jgi:tetratricopeptide (TPR) repeat protein
VKLALFPFGLSAEYVHAYPPHFWSAANLAGLALVALLIACAWRLRIKYPVITFGLAWFLVTLAPVLNLYELINPLAERYLYLPLVGVAIAAAAALEAVLFREGRARLPWVRQIAAGVVVCLLLGLSAYSFERNRVWQDNYTLFSQTAKRVPESARVHGGLGLAFQQMGRLSEAAREFRRAIALNPRLAHAHFSLANVLEQSGRIDEAIAAYERAAALEPGYGNVYYNLGGLYVKKGLLQQALTAYLRHLEFNPRDIEARNNLGVVYAMQGRLASAEAQWRQVLAIEPDNREALANLEKAKTVGAGGSD